MSTLFRTAVVVGILLIFIGSANALVGTYLGDPTVDPLDPGAVSDYTMLGSWHLVTGGGSDIGGTADHGYWAYMEAAGDGEMIVQVFNIAGGGDSYRRGGIMIRDSLDEDAVNFSNFILDLQSMGHRNAQVQVREETGGGTAVDAAPAENRGLVPYIKVKRTGDVFEAWYSDTGGAADWTSYGTWEVPMDGSIFVGLAVTSHENDPPEFATVTFRNLSTTGFVAPSTVTWKELGDGFWDVAGNWDPAGPPSATVHAILADTNSDRVTIRTAAEALTLDVLGGDIVIDGGSSLKVWGSVNFDTDTYLEMEAATALGVVGGTIPNMFADKGDVTVTTGADLVISHLDAHGIIAGTFTKGGAGKLQLDNTGVTGQVFADSTTFNVQQGVLASKGEDALGNAIGVILAGGTKLELANNPGAINMATAVTVDGSAEVNVDTTDGAYLGPLTLNDDLKTSGAGLGISFAGTSIPGSVTITTDIDTGLGPVTAPGVTVTKEGPDMLGVLSGGDVTGATFVVNQGTLMGVAMSNPFQDATELVLSGGRVLLANSSGAPAVVDTPVRLTADSTLDAGADGWPFAGPPSVTLGGTNGVNVDGKILYVGTVDGYTLDIAGVLADTGGRVQMTDGTVNVTGGGGGTSLDLYVDGSGTLSTTANLLTVNQARVYNGTLNVGAQLDSGNDVRVYGGLVETAAVLNVGDDLEVHGGVLNTGAEVNVNDDVRVLGSGVMTTGAPLHAGDDLEVYESGKLVLNDGATASEVKLHGSAQVSGSELIVSSYLAQNRASNGAWEALYSIDSGTFKASGTDMRNAVTLEFGGSTLTVSGAREVAADTSGNGYDGSIRGGDFSRFSSDVPAALAGGSSIDLSGGDYCVIVDTDNPAGADPDQNVFDLDTMTVSFWVKGWPDGAWEPFISKRGEGGQGWQVRRIDGGDRLGFTLRGPGSDDDPQDGTQAIRDNPDTWFHVVATYDGARKEWYVDGAVDTGIDISGGVNDTKSRLVFGARDNSDGDPANIGNFSRVRLDDIYIYDHALSEAEINELYNNTASIPTSGLLGKWTFDDLRPALDLPDTDFVVTDNSILAADTDASAIFGDLDLAAGKELTLETGGPSVSFDNVKAGDGASILGDTEVRGELLVGDSPGDLWVTGDLKMGKDSTYVWDLTDAGSDTVHVQGAYNKLTMANGWTVKVRTSEPFVAGRHLLFTYEGLLAPAAPNFLFEAPPEWNAAGLEMEVDLGGNVWLRVPEPSTWIMLLTAAAVGLVACVRRRRSA